MLGGLDIARKLVLVTDHHKNQPSEGVLAYVLYNF